MKRATFCFVAVCVWSSVSIGAFDHIISDAYMHGGITLHNESLLVSGSGTYLIEARESSYVEMQGTAPLQEFVGGVGGIVLDGTSVLNYFSGETGNLSIYDYSSATLHGGQIDFISSFQYVLSPNQNPLPHIEIVCDLESVFHDAQTNVLTGDWLDGSGFEIQLVDQAGYDSVIENMFFTPEPATLCMMGLGGLLLRRRRA